jgi:hypothetical protein
LPSSDFVSLFQICPRNGIFCWPKTTTMLMICRIISLFRLTFSAYDFKIEEYISFLSFDNVFVLLVALHKSKIFYVSVEPHSKEVTSKSIDSNDPWTFSGKFLFLLYWLHLGVFEIRCVIPIFLFLKLWLFSIP